MSKTSKCRLCGGDGEESFSKLLLQKHTVRYYKCHSCEYLYTEEPHWLDEAYSTAMALTDTGVLVRSMQITSILTFFAWLSGLVHLRGIDIGGGHGLLVRFLRDAGLDHYWSDPIAENLFAKGFDASPEVDYGLMTVIEVLEHVYNPVDFLLSSTSRYRPQCIIATTQLLPCAVPPHDWNYYQFSTGQHIGFFSERSLGVLAERIGYRFTTKRGLHVFSNNPRHHALLPIATSRLHRIARPMLTRVLKSRTLPDHDALVAALASRNMDSDR
jgi:hypothetical protein